MQYLKNREKNVTFCIRNKIFATKQQIFMTKKLPSLQPSVRSTALKQQKLNMHGKA